jgi:hypothetical protein
LSLAEMKAATPQKNATDKRIAEALPMMNWKVKTSQSHGRGSLVAMCGAAVQQARPGVRRFC